MKFASSLPKITRQPIQLTLASGATARGAVLASDLPK